MCKLYNNSLNTIKGSGVGLGIDCYTRIYPGSLSPWLKIVLTGLILGGVGAVVFKLKAADSAGQVKKEGGQYEVDGGNDDFSRFY